MVYHLESAQWWGRTRDLERYELAGTLNLVRAARAGARGANHHPQPPGRGRVVPPGHCCRSRAWRREIIRQSGLAWTIVRSGLIFGEEDSFINAIALSLRANPLFFLMPAAARSRCSRFTSRTW